MIVVRCLLFVVCCLFVDVVRFCCVLGVARCVCFSLRADCCSLVYDVWFSLPFVVCRLSLWWLCLRSLLVVCCSLCFVVRCMS